MFKGLGSLHRSQAEGRLECEDMSSPCMRSSRRFLETFSVAHCTVVMEMSVAINLHLFILEPNKGYMQDVPVPVQRLEITAL